MNNNFLKETGIKNINFSKAKISGLNHSSLSSSVENKVFGVFSYLAAEHNKINRMNYAN